MTQALAYDDLPEGSDLRRDYDGRGGVTITAPAGELSASVRRATGRAGVVRASFALAALMLLVGLQLLEGSFIDRIDRALRVPAVVALAVLAGGVFLLVWFRHYSEGLRAASEARRQSCVLHAAANRLLVETAGPHGKRSLELAAAEIASVQIVRERLDPARRSARVPCLMLLLRDGSNHLLLGGHHRAELQWAAAALSQAIGVPVPAADPPISTSPGQI